MKVSAARRAYWEKHVSDWEQSGLTQKAYCSREGLTYGSFKNWRSQLIDKACPQTPSFVEASSVEPEKSLSNALVLQISLSNGSRIGVCAQASDKIIGHVLTLAGKAL
jgi:hypothetical protein